MYRDRGIEGEILCTESKKEQSGKGRSTVEGKDKVCEITSGRYRK